MNRNKVYAKSKENQMIIKALNMYGRVPEMWKLLKEVERLNNIINTILDFNFFKEECPLNFGYTEKSDEEKAQDVFYEDDYCEKNCNDEYKKCWLKYFERLQELKGDGSND